MYKKTYYFLEGNSNSNKEVIGISKVRAIAKTVLKVGLIRAVSIRAIWLSAIPDSKASCSCVSFCSFLIFFSCSANTSSPETAIKQGDQTAYQNDISGTKNDSCGGAAGSGSTGSAVNG